jgi:hypothetical protein
LRGARRLTYADARMRNVLLSLLHLAVMAAKLCGPGGVRAVIAENLVLKQQLIVLRRGRQRAPNLRVSDRLLCGFGSLFLSPGRIRKLAMIGTMRREFLDHVMFWNAHDLERKLAEFQVYYNAARSHSSLDGRTPLTFAGGHTAAPADLSHVRWVSHCRDLVQLPVAA